MSRPNPYLMFFGGALVGAAAATLLTPRSGPEARKLMRERAERAVEVAQTALAKAQAALDDAHAKTVHVPTAVSAAGEAAREAFVSSYADVPSSAK